MTTEETGRQGLSTRSVHAGRPARRVGDPVAGSIVQSTTFVSDPSGEGEVLYSRYGNNPNHLSVEARIAALEGAEACLVTSSGMAAMASALLSLLKAGDHVLAATALYGGTRRFLDQELSRLGIEASYADLNQSGWADEIRPNTRVVLAEITANPLLRVPDLEAIAAVTDERGLKLVVDVTFATPVNLRGLELGADLVVHSATKYLGGHSDVTAGAVCGSRSLIDEARMRSILFGSAMDPAAAWLLERGIKTLALRVHRQNENGLAVALWASDHDQIERVHYPGIPSHPDHEIGRRLLDGFGGMIGLEVVGGPARATALIEALRMVTPAPSLGGVETLVSEPRFTSHAHLSGEQRAELGIPDGFLRFSLGIEDADDIIADLEQALAASRDVAGR